jgi:hypothetical protein
MSELLAAGKDLKNLSTTFTLQSNGTGLVEMSGDGYKPELRLTAAEIAEAVKAWTPKPAPPAPKPEPTPTPPAPTPAPNGSLPPEWAPLIGLNAGNWGSQSWADIVSTGVQCVRLDESFLTDTEVQGYATAGVRVGSALFDGGYFDEAGGVAKWAAEAQTKANAVVAYFEKYGLGGSFWSSPAEALKLGSVCAEVGNEVYGTWFYGPDAQAEYESYFQALKVFWAAITDSFAPAIRPVLLASTGSGVGSEWAQGLAKLGAASYMHGSVVHPYGGPKGESGGAQGNRAEVEWIYKLFGKRVYVTEVGWPTGSAATSDSQAWTEAEQAANIKSFGEWTLANSSMLGAFCVYNYVDEEEGPRRYGVEKRSRVHKLGFAALGEIAKLAAA